MVQERPGARGYHLFELSHLISLLCYFIFLSGVENYFFELVPEWGTGIGRGYLTELES